MASNPENPLARLNPDTKTLVGRSLTDSTARRINGLAKTAVYCSDQIRNDPKAEHRARVFLAKIAVITEEYCGCMLDLAGEFNKADSAEIEKELL